MVATGELKEVFIKNREEYEQETALLTRTDLESLKKFYNDFKNIVCPLEDSTFEEFLGYMVICGLNNTKDELARIIGYKQITEESERGLFE